MSKERTAKIQIIPNRIDINSDHVFEAMFPVSKKNEEKNHGSKAKQIVIMASQRGEEGLHSRDWETLHKELGLTLSEYYHILKRLRNLGVLKKSGARYYVSKEFSNHLSRLAASMHGFLLEQGVKV